MKQEAKSQRTESWGRPIYKVWTEKEEPMKEVKRGHKRDRKSISISDKLRKESILRNGLSVTNISWFKEKDDKTYIDTQEDLGDRFLLNRMVGLKAT